MPSIVTTLWDPLFSNSRSGREYHTHRSERQSQNPDHSPDASLRCTSPGHRHPGVLLRRRSLSQQQHASLHDRPQPPTDPLSSQHYHSFSSFSSSIVVSSFFSQGLARLIFLLLTRVGSLSRCSLYASNNFRLHQHINFRLGLLQTVSQTFLLFAACLLRLQATTLYANIRLSIPADIFISSQALQKDAFSSFLHQPQHQALHDGFEFMAASVSQGTLSSFAQLSTVQPTVSFLTPHYLDLM